MKTRIIIAALMACVISGCCAKERTIDFPTAKSTNTTTVIIEKVELTDSVTAIHMRGYNYPGWWIRMVSETHLMADGVKYEMTGTEGITPDEYLWMPSDGDSLFVLKFEPLPLKTKEFDFIEGYDEGAFRFLGIDATGKPADAYDKGLPRRIRTTPDSVTDIPEFDYSIGETTVNVHVLGYSPLLGDKLQVFINDAFSGQNEHNADIDPETGTGSVTFMQYGTCEGFVVMDGTHMGSFRIGPGETVDLWCDAGYNDYWATQVRKTDKPVRAVKSLYSEGSRYDVLNNLPMVEQKLSKVKIEPLYYPEYDHYKMNADQWTDMVISEYDKVMAMLDTIDIHPITRRITETDLKLQTVAAVSKGDSQRLHSYRLAHNLTDWSKPVDYTPDLITDAHIQKAAQMLDLDDPVIMLCKYWTFIGAADPEKDKMLTTVYEAVEQAQSGRLTDEKLSEMKSWDNPFYAQMCEDINRRALALMESGSDAVQKTPDVPLDKLFEAIIEPHKGKVVLVDFWNTWCGPCRNALKTNEPYKSGELSSEDIVWIYIANETSPMDKYLQMIPEIKGLHYRLNQEQWEQLTKKDFTIDGIPSYVLVKKDGSYALSNEFRDHSLMVKTLKSESGL